jgi:phosphoglycolate phosphatase
MTSGLGGATIVFDLDGTLIDTAPDLIGALNHVLIAEGLSPVSMRDVGLLVGQGARAMIERGMAIQGVRPPAPAMDAHFAAFIAHYSDHIADHSHLFDGAANALDHLLDSGAKLAVCTNKSQKLADQLLQELQILQKFSAVVGADSVPKRKPHGDHILLTIKAAGGNPARAVMVGDSRTDERAARNAGLPFIFVPFGYEVETAEQLHADAVISHYSDLVRVIAKLIA